MKKNSLAQKLNNTCQIRPKQEELPEDTYGTHIITKDDNNMLSVEFHRNAVRINDFILDNEDSFFELINYLKELAKAQNLRWLFYADSKDWNREALLKYCGFKEEKTFDNFNMYLHLDTLGCA